MRLIGKGKIAQLTGLTIKQVNKLVRSKNFPSEIVVSPNHRGWNEDDIQDWLVQRLSMARQSKNTVGGTNDSGAVFSRNLIPLGSAHSERGRTKD